MKISARERVLSWTPREMANSWITFCFRMPQHWPFVFLHWAVVIVKATFLLSFPAT